MASFILIINLIEDALIKTSKAVAIQMIIDFAEGKDGKLGTADDRLNPETLELLKSMINDGSIYKLVDKLYVPSGFFHRIYNFLKNIICSRW